MGILQRTADASFIEDTSTGQVAFYPWGWFTKGYIINSKQKEQELRLWAYKMMRIKMLAVILIFLISTLTSVVFGFFDLDVSPLIPIIIGFVLFGYYVYQRSKPHLSRLERTSTRLGCVTGFKMAAKTQRLRTLVLYGIFFVFLVIMGFSALVSGTNFSIILLVLLLFFGFIAGGYIYAIWLKLKNRQE